MRVNMITRQMTSFFSCIPKALSVGMFQGLQNSIPWAPAFGLSSGLQNTYLHVKEDTFKPVNIDIPFLCRTYKLLAYNMLCSQFDVNLNLIP